MKTDDAGVQVEIHLNSHGIAHILREAQSLWQEHEEAGKLVVQVSMAFPERSIRQVLGAVVRLGEMYMLKNGLKQLAHDNDDAESVVRSTTEHLG